MSVAVSPLAVSITGTGLFTPPESISNAELAASLTASVEKFNADHADACREIAAALAGCVDAESAHVSALDRRGITIDVRNHEGAPQAQAVARVAWPHPLTTPDEVRPASVELVRRARIGGAS